MDKMGDEMDFIEFSFLNQMRNCIIDKNKINNLTIYNNCVYLQSKGKYTQLLWHI